MQVYHVQKLTEYLIHFFPNVLIFKKKINKTKVVQVVGQNLLLKQKNFENLQNKVLLLHGLASLVSFQP